MRDVGDSRRQRPDPWTEMGLFEGVPRHMFIPLHRWVEKRHIEVQDYYWDRAQLQTRTSIFDGDLLARAEFILRLYPRDQPGALERWVEPTSWRRLTDELDEILTLGGSAWRVNGRRDGLERRTEPHTTTAARAAIAVASPIGRDHLLSAWAAAYGKMPDPDKAFNEAIRAVEDIACPLVEPTKAAAGKSTLGSVIGELRSNSFDKWELLIPDGNGVPRDVGPLVAMMEVLWQSQLSRHAGAPKSRRQVQSESEAVLPLAVLLVQWLSTGVLRRRT